MSLPTKPRSEGKLPVLTVYGVTFENCRQPPAALACCIYEMLNCKQNGVNPPFHAALAFLGTSLVTYRMRTYYGSTSLLGVQECFISFPKGVVNRPSVQMQAEKHRLSCQLAEMVTCGVCSKQQKNLPISHHWFSDRGFMLH